MTPSRTLRPALVLLAGSLVAACSGVDQDHPRFEAMARSVADIPLDGTERVAHERGLRPAFPDSAPETERAVSGPRVRAPALTVQVMDPHDLWDARDGLRPPHLSLAPVETAVVPVEPAQLRPAFPARQATARQAVERPAGPRATIQLGAYSSAEAARTAWAEVRQGKAREALGGLTPQFETIQRQGKALVRLRVSAPAVTAAAICRAAEVADPWCLNSH